MPLLRFLCNISGKAKDWVTLLSLIGQELALITTLWMQKKLSDDILYFMTAKSFTDTDVNTGEPG